MCGWGRDGRGCCTSRLLLGQGSWRKLLLLLRRGRWWRLLLLKLRGLWSGCIRSLDCDPRAFADESFRNRPDA